MAYVVMIVALVAPVVGRVLVTLGVGWITFEVFSTITDNLITAVQDNWDNMPADVLAYLTIGGFTTGIEILLGAIVVRVTWMVIPRLGRLI